MTMDLNLEILTISAVRWKSAEHVDISVFGTGEMVLDR